MTKENQTDLEFIQEKELEMAKIIMSICDKHDIEYYIMGGTLLGAVRHQGFIPWDDDLDIGMKRQDYEKFLDLVAGELPNNFGLKHFTTDSDFPYPYIRIENEKVQLRRDYTKNKTIQNLWVDIFPLDGVPAGGFERFKWEKTLTLLREMRNLSCLSELVNLNKKHGGFKKSLIVLALNLKVEKLFKTGNWTRRIDDFLKSYPVDEMEMIGNPMGGHWFKEVYPSSFYKETSQLAFEGIKMTAPKNYIEILLKMYGDYMQLPKEDERNWHGTTLLTDKNK
ncbi:LicD family protein [Streptococcus sp. KCJ4932]|uniref:LicD family protein n=1 Tax=Streptococcus sp. KCJ4932 TaxID=2545465 RepID=UPI00105635DB|nr:LicD family protein [Streptococcus sp. KCJ4932]TDE68807.1 LicD family protein [Streptococcus sp. KCJ4932]